MTVAVCGLQEATQTLVVKLQTGVAGVATQSVSLKQPTQVFAVVLQTGVVPEQSVEDEQPQVPVLAWHTGVGFAQVVTVFQPVWVALQISRMFPARHRCCPTLQVGVTHWLLLQSIPDAHWVLLEQPHVPALAWHSGVVPPHVVTSSQPVRVALQI